MTNISGLWLPLITPFKDGAVDFTSYRRLVEHYVAAGVEGLFPLGTTGEAPTLDDEESEALVEATLEAARGRVPVFVGVGGNDTRKVEKTLKRLERRLDDGFALLVVERRRLARGAEREQAVDPGGDVVLDQAAIAREVDGTVLERRDERQPEARDLGHGEKPRAPC